jgi:hypothetical protein
VQVPPSRAPWPRRRLTCGRASLRAQTPSSERRARALPRVRRLCCATTARECARARSCDADMKCHASTCCAAARCRRVSVRVPSRHHDDDDAPAPSYHIISYHIPRALRCAGARRGGAPERTPRLHAVAAAAARLRSRSAHAIARQKQLHERTSRYVHSAGGGQRRERARRRAEAWRSVVTQYAVCTATQAQERRSAPRSRTAQPGGRRAARAVRLRSAQHT